MKRLVTGLLSVLVVAAISPAARSAEGPVVKLVLGAYINWIGRMEPEWSMELDLRKDGSARYTVSTWEAEKGPASKKKDVFLGRWEVKADLLTVTFSEDNVGKTLEYRVTDCLDYMVYTSLHCTHGLEPVAGGTSHVFSQPLWYTVKVEGSRK